METKSKRKIKARRAEYKLNSNKSEKNRNKTKIIMAVLILFVILIVTVFFLLKPPYVKLNGNEYEEIEYGSDYEEKGIVVIQDEKNISDKVKIEKNIDKNKLGEYKVIYKIPYLNFTYDYIKTVKIVDTTKPVITLENGEKYKTLVSEEYKEPGYKSIDNYDGDITSKVETWQEKINDKEMKVHYKSTDSSNNMSEVIRTIYFVNTIKPEINLNGEQTIKLKVGSEYKEEGANAKDELEGDLTSKIEVSGTVNTSKAGTYAISYKIKDSCGNEAIINRNVIVENVENQNTVGKAGTVYLTFDDGPSSDITPKILDILKNKNIKATFFILNYSDSNAHLVKRIVNEGHAIGIHGYSHDYAKIYTSEDAFMSNVTKLGDKIKQTTGVNTKITRFPGGTSNTISKKYSVGIMTKLTKTLLNQGYKYYDWNISSGDAGGAKTKEEVYNNVVKNFKKNRANMVLMHDFSGNTKTLNALSDIIDYGKSNGYTFDKITESTAMVAHNPQN